MDSMESGVSALQLDRSPIEGQIRSPWALKMLNKEEKPIKDYSERLKEEAELLQKMSHPNIVGFIAFSGDKILYSGIEARDDDDYESGNLGDMIITQIEAHYGPFSPKQVLKVAVDIGSALEYLHTSMKILHGDIKSDNVIVNGDFDNCKLCGFGVTLPLNENGVFDETTGVHYYGTEAWSAPEVIHGLQISDKTDMWSFGLTLWQMMALVPPHCPDYDDNFFASIRGLDDAAISNARDDYCFQRYGTRPGVPPEVSVELSAEQYVEPLSLFHACTEAEGERRPSARDLALLAADMLNKCSLTTP